MKRAVFLYDYTGLMAQPWLEAGYECWCFDGQHPEGITRDNLHVKVGMWFDADRTDEQAKIIAAMVGDNVALVFGFPECTDLTVAGARHWAKKALANANFQINATQLADLVRKVGELCNSSWAFENPVGALSTLYRKPDFSFHPCDYAGYLPEDDVHPVYPEVYPGRDLYNKNTCIWCSASFNKPVKRRLEPISKDNPGWLYCGGKSKRTKNIRSATPRGFARAVFEANSK